MAKPFEFIAYRTVFDRLHTDAPRIWYLDSAGGETLERGRAAVFGSSQLARAAIREAVRHPKPPLMPGTRIPWIRRTRWVAVVTGH